MKDWDQFYIKEQTLRDFLGSAFTHTRLFEEIVKEKPARILEIGVGTGITGIFLSHLGYDITAIDNNEKVIESANNFANRLNAKVRYIAADAQKLDKIFKEKEFDLAFSQGFFEHFSDQQIREYLLVQLKVAKIVLISVPSKFYLNTDFGNERLMSREKWLKILNGFKVDFVEYYGFFLPKRETVNRLIFNPYLIYKFFRGTFIKERSHLLIKARSY